MKEKSNFEFVEDLKGHVPPALYDRMAETMRKDGCYSPWQYLLACVDEMSETWESEHGDNLVWIPGHYESLY